jgi:hypothetical protein
MGKVLSAQGSGYFPFCITKADSVPKNAQGGTFYPVGLTIKQATALFWKVKKWTFADAFLGKSSPSFSLFGSPENEEGFVCASGFSYDNVFYGDLIPGAFSQIIYFDLFTSTIIQQASEKVLRVGDLYYPRLFFSGQYADDTGFLASGLTYQDLSAPYLSGVFRINFADTTISVDLYSAFEDVNFYIADLTADEYWSYGGIYDTTTGEPLT